MTLFTLPNEIIIRIIDYLCPDDVENFSGTCKLLVELSTSRFEEHETMKKQYGYMELYSIEDYCHSSYSSPIKLLRTIVDDPRIAHYPKALRILSYDVEDHENFAGDVWPIDSDDIEEEKRSLIEQYHGFRDLLSDCPYLTDEEASDWPCRITVSEDDEAIALLLTLLPNLEHLTFWGNSQTVKESVKYLVHRIARISSGREAAPRANDHDSVSRTTWQTHPLSKLRSIKIEEPADPAAESVSYGYDLLAPFAEIPSLQNMICKNITAADLRHYDPPPTLEDPEDYDEVSVADGDAGELPFFGLRSLRSIHDRTYVASVLPPSSPTGLGDLPHPPLPPTPPLSNVDQLNLESSEVDLVTLKPLLAKLTQLRSFHFSHSSRIETPDQFSEMLRLFIGHCNKSLKELILHNPVAGLEDSLHWDKSVHLHHFWSLTRLDVDLEFLVNKHLKSCPPTAWLPRSLRMIRLGAVQNVLLWFEEKHQRAARLAMAEIIGLRDSSLNLLDGCPRLLELTEDKTRSDIHTRWFGATLWRSLFEDEEIFDELVYLYEEDSKKVPSVLALLQHSHLYRYSVFSQIFKRSGNVVETFPNLTEAIVETSDVEARKYLRRILEGTEVELEIESDELIG